MLSAIPDADGIVGDLGGGSLELVEISAGRVRRSASLPLGVLRLDALAEKGSFAKRVGKAVAAAGFEGACAGRPFYMVGGSWRAVARLDMALTGHPLPVTHQHRMAADRPRALRDQLAAVDKALIQDLPSVSVSRFPTLPNANRLLDALVGALDARSSGRLQLRHPRGPALRRAAARGAGARSADRGRARGGGGARPLRPAWRAARRLDRAGLRRRARRGAAQARRLPARRHRLGGAPRFPRRARHRHGAARQLGGDRRARPGDARPGPVLQFRRRPRASLSRHRRSVRPGGAAPGLGLGLCDAARPAPQRRRRRGPQAQPAAALRRVRSAWRSTPATKRCAARSSSGG